MAEGKLVGVARGAERVAVQRSGFSPSPHLCGAILLLLYQLRMPCQLLQVLYPAMETPPARPLPYTAAVLLPLCRLLRSCWTLLLPLLCPPLKLFIDPTSQPALPVLSLVCE
jgi:hypothetical protein